MTDVEQAGGERSRDSDRERVFPRDEHGISRKAIPESVLKVLYRLHRSGHRAYLCGGSVRDLLLGRVPKDFDVVTDARPQELRRLFRNSRIIGRRFRLVHILFQDMVVEVATFRREPEANPAEGEVLVRSDNTFGSPQEDARRRDFTVNGLFYDIADYRVLDYVDGVADLQARLIRVIGDADLRFREDPVRMLRAIEFAARLDFEIEAATFDAIVEHREEILKASPARVTDELLELLRRGFALESIHLLDDTQVLRSLIPEVSELLESGRAAYFWKMLEVLDRTTRSGRVLQDTMLLSVVAMPTVVEAVFELETAKRERMQPLDVLPFIRERIESMMRRLVIPAWMRHEIEQNLELVWRFQEPPSDNRRDLRLMLRDRSSDALALFELYAISSGRYADAFAEWHALARRVRAGERPARSRARRRRRR